MVRMKKIKWKRKKNQRGECWKEAEWDCKVCKNLNEKYQKKERNWGTNIKCWCERKESLYEVGKRLRIHKSMRSEDKQEQ